MSVDKGKTARSVAWSAIEGGGLSVMGLLSLIAFSRILSPRDFGLYATALSIIELLSLITNLAFHDALVQVQELTRAHKNTAFTINVAASVFLFLLTWAASPLFAAGMHEPEAGTILMLMGGTFLLSGPSATLTAQQRRAFQFRTLAMRSLIGRLAGSLLGVGAALMGFGVWSLVIQQLSMAALSSIILWILSDDRPRFGYSAPVAKELVIFGVAAAGAEFVNAGIKRIFALSCGVILGAQAAGYINIAFRLVDTLWGVTATAIYQVILPVMSRLQDDRGALNRVFARAQATTAALLYFVYACVAGGALQVIALLFGREWLPAAPFVTLLSAMMLLQAPRMLSVPILTAMGRPRDVLIGYSSGLVYMAVALMFVPFDTAARALEIWFGTEIVYTILFVWLLRRASGIGPIFQLRNIAAPLAAGLATFAQIRITCTMLDGHLPAIATLLVAGAIGTVLFAALLAIFDRGTMREVLGYAVQLLPARLRPGRDTPQG